MPIGNHQVTTQRSLVAGMVEAPELADDGVGPRAAVEAQTGCRSPEHDTHERLAAGGIHGKLVLIP